MGQVRFNAAALEQFFAYSEFRSLAAWAKSMGMTRQNLANLLRHPPVRLSLVTLGHLCMALDCSPGDLLFWDKDAAQVPQAGNRPTPRVAIPPGGGAPASLPVVPVGDAAILG